MNKKILVLCNHNIVLYNFKKELIKAEILEEDGWNLYDTSIYYKLKYGFTKGVLSGDNYYKKIIFLLAYNIAIYII